MINPSPLFITTRREVLWNRRFGTTYRFHIQGSSCPRRRTAWLLMMGPIGSAETSVSNLLSPHNNPEMDQTDHLALYISVAFAVTTFTDGGAVTHLPCTCSAWSGKAEMITYISNSSTHWTRLLTASNCALNDHVVMLQSDNESNMELLDARRKLTRRHEWREEATTEQRVQRVVSCTGARKKRDENVSDLSGTWLYTPPVIILKGTAWNTHRLLLKTHFDHIHTQHYGTSFCTGAAVRGKNSIC